MPPGLLVEITALEHSGDLDNASELIPPASADGRPKRLRRFLCRSSANLPRLASRTASPFASQPVSTLERLVDRLWKPSNEVLPGRRTMSGCPERVAAAPGTPRAATSALSSILAWTHRLLVARDFLAQPLVVLCEPRSASASPTPSSSNRRICCSRGQRAATAAAPRCGRHEFPERQSLCAVVASGCGRRKRLSRQT